MARYARTLLLWLLVWLGLAAGINAAVDPYGIFGFVRASSFNEIKSRAGQRGLVLRRQLISSWAPNALVVGNSRAEVGFDPEHASWPRALRPVVNAAVPGTGVGTTRRIVEHAAATGSPRLIVAGLDYLDFRVKQRSSTSEQVDLTTVRSPERWNLRFKEYLEALASVDALYDSIATVLAQHNRYAPRVSRYGFNPMLDYVRMAAAEGYGTLFLQRNRENALNYLRGGRYATLSEGGSQELRDLRRLLDLAVTGGIELHLVIYPYHAHTLELFRLTGLWHGFEQWKREMAMLVEEVVRARASKSAKVRLWDFSGYSRFATEPVPRLGDKRSTVKWYWEAGHFKKELGDVVLARVLGADSDDQTPDDSRFGVLLSSANVDAHLDAISKAGSRYRNMRHDEVQALTALVERLKSSGQVR